MAAPLTKCTKESQWYVKRFLYSEDVTTSEYYGRMIIQYGDYLRATGEYTNGLNEWRQLNIANSARSGMSSNVTCAEVKELIISVSGTSKVPDI
jgi:hypothetical protein